MRLATRLSTIELQDTSTGKPQALGALWADGPAVVIFIRHFG